MNISLTSKKISPAQHWNGADYHRISSPQFNINKAFLNEYIFHGDETILDIGCGDGRTSREIAKKIPHGEILGIDASNSMIEIANKNNKYTHLRFQLMNVQQIDFSNQFDVGICFFCMQWVPDKKDTFRRIYQSLKQQGRFLMIVPLPHPYLPMIRQQLISSPRWKKYFGYYEDPLIYINDSNYEIYAQTAGFREFHSRIDDTPVIFKNYDIFFDFLNQMTPHLSCLPLPNEKADFMHELLEQYLKINPIASDGSCNLTFNLIKCCAIQ